MLGHVDEAKADISEAQGREGGERDGDVLAVGTSLGMEGYAEYVGTPEFCQCANDGPRKLSAAAGHHPFALDIAEKTKAFDEAALKFVIAK